LLGTKTTEKKSQKAFMKPLNLQIESNGELMEEKYKSFMGNEHG
jgi:hypothetical protein